MTSGVAAAEAASWISAMARREPISTLNEELRRLTPDLVYQEVLATLLEEPVND